VPHVWRRHRFRNLAATAALIGAIVLVAAGVGWLLGGQLGVALTLGAGLLVGALAPRPPMERALWQRGARRLHAPWLEDAVERMSRRAGLERAPVLLGLPEPVPQAFATEGARGPAIGVTPALLRHLHPREVVAVVAHELSHLRAGDLGLMRVVAVVAGLTRSAAQIGLLLLLFSVPLAFASGLSVPWLSVAVLLVAPSVLHLLSLALSRVREHDADAGAVELCGDPLALASALVKIERAARGPWWLDFFRVRMPERWQTHPRTEARVARLREMAGVPATA